MVLDLQKTSSNRGWVGLLIFALMFGVVTGGLATFDTQQVMADEDAPADDGAEEEVAEEDAADKAPESFLSWLIRASGAFGFILLALSFVMVALIMMNVLQVRRDILLPPDFIEAFEEKLGAKDYQGAYELAKNDDSFLARVLVAGLGKLNRGYAEAIEGMQEVGEDENMALEHRLSYLALIGSIGPMVGLMGTVYGMIQSFQKIANSDGLGDVAEVAIFWKL